MVTAAFLVSLLGGGGDEMSSGRKVRMDVECHIVVSISNGIGWRDVVEVKFQLSA